MGRVQRREVGHGKERQQAEAAGARFLWPRFTKAITATGVELTNDEILPAETVIVSIGDQPDLDFLPPVIETARGFIAVNEQARTSDAQVYAVGDAVKAVPPTAPGKDEPTGEVVRLDRFRKK